MGLLIRVERKVVRGGGSRKKDEEREKGKTEMKKMLRRLKDEMARGGDGIPNEV